MTTILTGFSPKPAGCGSEVYRGLILYEAEGDKKFGEVCD